MKRIYYAALAVALTFTACKQDDGLTLTVNGVSPQKKSLEELPEWNRKQYLLLRDTVAKEVIGEVDKIEIRPELNRIYILDAKPRAGVVAAYDTAGHFLSAVAFRGGNALCAGAGFPAFRVGIVEYGSRRGLQIGVDEPGDAVGADGLRLHRV